MDSLKVSKWVFSLDQRATGWFRDCLKVAVVSARKYTKLEPICLLDGDVNSEFSRWLIGAGVTVIKHEVPFKAELFSDHVLASNSGSPYNPAQASGAYLRIEAAGIIGDPYFLYTDCDIMFLGDPVEGLLPPTIFSATPEVVLTPSGYLETETFNSGVMVINGRNFSIEVRGFIDFCRARNFYNRQNSSYDQTHLNLYFKGRWEPLTETMNWRPFQGVNHEARIVHFHGPKPQRINKILSGEASAQEIEHMQYLIESNRSSYEFYVSAFDELLKEAD